MDFDALVVFGVGNQLQPIIPQKAIVENYSLKIALGFFHTVTLSQYSRSP